MAHQPTALQRTALQRIALRSRVRAVTGGRLDPGETDLDPSVPGLVVDDEAFYQTDDLRGLGPALRWASSNGARSLVVLAEAEVAGHLARRVGHLGPGSPIERVEVWSARGPEVEPAVAAPVEPVPELPESHRRFASMVAEAGARPIDDHGLLVAEVAGLEVARVIDDPDRGGPRLSVGVGQADRELQGFVNGHLDDDANLRRAIAAVARHRRPGSAAHPLSRLSRARWLRSVLLDDPGLLGHDGLGGLDGLDGIDELDGLDGIEPLPPLRPSRTVLGTEPAAARGEGVVVVCSVGVDLDLVPEAADYRHRDDPDAELIVVVPERDRRLVAGPLAGAVPRLGVVSIEVPWEAAPAS